MSRLYTRAMEVNLSPDLERKLARAAAPRPLPITRCVLLSLVLLTGTASLGAAQTTTCDSSQFDKLTNMWKFEPDQNTREVTPPELRQNDALGTFGTPGAFGTLGRFYSSLARNLQRCQASRYLKGVEPVE